MSRPKSRSYADRDLKRLFGLSAFRCAFAECRRCYVDATPDDGDVITGKIAHIRGFKAGGPRYDPTYAPQLLNDYENLVLLCGTCHDEVDGQPNTFTIQQLLDVKREHEQWVNDRLSEELASIGF